VNRTRSALYRWARFLSDVKAIRRPHKIRKRVALAGTIALLAARRAPHAGHVVVGERVLEPIDPEVAAGVEPRGGNPVTIDPPEADSSTFH
jgi:hypothetical protein